jgi:hypothetical protein
MRREELSEAVAGNATLLIGDLSETVPPFLSRLTPEAPIGFAILDVDYYSSARAALGVFTGPPSGYLPFFPVHVDDIRLPSHNSRAGEALAIEEFNREHPSRLLAFDRFLVHSRIFKHAEWLSHAYTLHVLDHAERNDLSPREVRDPGNPYLFSA